MNFKNIKFISESEVLNYIENTTNIPLVFVAVDINNNNCKIGLQYVDSNIQGFGGRVAFIYSEIKDKLLLEKLKITKVPTIIAFYNNKEIYRKDGMPLSLAMTAYEISKKAYDIIKSEKTSSVSKFF